MKISPLLTCWDRAERACLESDSALSTLSTADKRIGTKTDFKHYLATDGKHHIFKGAEIQFGLIVRLQEVGVSSHPPCRKSRRVQCFKNRLYKMADMLLRTFMGFCPCSRTVAITRFLTCCSFIGQLSLAQWILIHCSDIWILSASALIRRPSAGLLAWTLCRPLLLNFWTFLWTRTWPRKKKIYSWQRTSNCW